MVERPKLSFTLSSLSLGDGFDTEENDDQTDVLDDLFGALPDVEDLQALEDEVGRVAIDLINTDQRRRPTPAITTTTTTSPKILATSLPFSPITPSMNPTPSLPFDHKPIVSSVPLLPNLSLRDRKQLGLTASDEHQLQDTFLTLHLHTNGTIDVDGFHDFFQIPKSPWSANVFAYLDVDRNGSIDFIEWVAFTSHICTAKEDGLARMVFAMYDHERIGHLDTATVVQLLHDVHSGGSTTGTGSPNSSDTTWSPSFVGQKVGKALAPLPLDPVTGFLTLETFCAACQEHNFVLSPIRDLATTMIAKVGGELFWNNIIDRARKQVTVASKARKNSCGGTMETKKEIQQEVAAQSTTVFSVNGVDVTTVLEGPEKNRIAKVTKVDPTTTTTTHPSSVSPLPPVPKNVVSTNWFHRFGLKYQKGGLLVPWTTAPTDQFLETLLVPHHGQKQGHISGHKHPERHHHHLLKPLLPELLTTPSSVDSHHSRSLASMMTPPTTATGNRKQIRSRIHDLEHRLLQSSGDDGNEYHDAQDSERTESRKVTSPPPDLEHPKHFYNRVRPQTAADRRGDTVRNNALKSHVEQVLVPAAAAAAAGAAVTATAASAKALVRRKRPASANVRNSKGFKGSRSSSEQQLAFKQMTRSWKKTPCFFCGLEGHLMHQCKRLIQKKKTAKVKRRLLKSGMRSKAATKVSRRIVLSSVQSPSSSNALMSHITGGMNSKRRAQLLAFAVKKSLIEAVSWADQARYTGAAMEQARKARKRHDAAHVKKNRHERIQRLKPREMGLF